MLTDTWYNFLFELTKAVTKEIPNLAAWQPLIDREIMRLPPDTAKRIALNISRVVDSYRG